MDQYMRRIKPYEGDKPYIFISYCHRDSRRVLPLLHMLESAGFRFWYDEGIDPGTEWPESIATHLEKSKVCLSLISPEYVISNNCRREINFALARNLDFLSVILEPTQMTPGMEMQISSYMSLVAYKYPTQEDFFEKLCNVEILQECRDPAKDAETLYTVGIHQSDVSSEVSKSKKKNGLLAKILIPVIVIIIAGYFILSRTTGKTDDLVTVSQAENTQVLITSPEVTETPAVSSPPSVIEEEASVPSEPLASPESDEEPALSGETPENGGYRRLLYGEWTYGSITVSAADEKCFHVELKDNRIPYGYPMSETPGNNDASWNVQFIMSMRDNVFVDLRGDESTPSFQKLSADKSYTIKGSFQYGGIVEYDLEDNTFIFDVSMSKSFPFNVDDLQMIYINLGTQAPGYVDHYDFYPD